jgi:hypothetical protein
MVAVRQNLEGFVTPVINTRPVSTNILRVSTKGMKPAKARCCKVCVLMSAFCSIDHGPTLVFANHKLARAGTVDVRGRFADFVQRRIREWITLA